MMTVKAIRILCPEPWRSAFAFARESVLSLFHA